ncbi:MAG: hypothetical protein GF364_15445, partial [Candidatus Lokiarchaeota archaeon]|nr:hypothetical protein [Candidatus Lokiarchaeota archaeon]
GLYFDYDHAEKKRIKKNTIASFFPIISGIVKESKVKQLLTHIENEDEYNTKIPFPSVSRSSKHFQKDMWRGPVWLNTAYTIVKGLEYSNLEQLAGKFAYNLVKGVAFTYSNEGSVYEFYDPDNYTLNSLSRKKGNLFKKMTLGDKPVKKFVGWTGVVNTMLIENIIGYRRIKDTVMLKPHLPKVFVNHTVRLKIPQFNEILSLEIFENQNISAKLICYDEKDNITSEIIFEGKNHTQLTEKN